MLCADNSWILQCNGGRSLWSEYGSVTSGDPVVRHCVGLPHRWSDRFAERWLGGWSLWEVCRLQTWHITVSDICHLPPSARLTYRTKMCFEWRVWTIYVSVHQRKIFLTSSLSKNLVLTTLCETESLWTPDWCRIGVAAGAVLCAVRVEWSEQRVEQVAWSSSEQGSFV